MTGSVARSHCVRSIKHTLLIVITVVAVFVLLIVLGRIFGDDSPSRLSEQTESTFDLPAEESIGSVEFAVSEGQSSLVTLDVEALFEASTEDRRGAYVVVGVACAATGGSTSTDSISGTQNLIHDEQTQLRTQFVYTASVAGPHRCNATFRAPNWDPEFGDATATVEAQVAVTHGDYGVIEEATPTSETPIVPDSGETVTPIDETIEVEPDLEWIEVAATSHLTTCTIENGSRDQTDDNLCRPNMLDEEGSEVRIESRIEVLDGDDICETIQVQEESTHITHQVHHLLAGTSPRRIELEDGLCGDELRLIQTIENDGPAPLVVHRGSSNVMITGRSDVRQGNSQ